MFEDSTMEKNLPKIQNGKKTASKKVTFPDHSVILMR